MIIQEWMQSDISLNIGWLIVHSLWQITIIGLITSFVLLIVSMKPSTKYRLAYTMLLLMAVSPLATFFIIESPVQSHQSRMELISQTVSITNLTDFPEEQNNVEALNPTEPESTFPTPNEILETSVNNSIASEQPSYIASWKSRFIKYSSWIAPCWVAGVLLLIIKQFGAWMLIRSVLKNTSPIKETILQTRIKEIASSFGIQQMVRVVQSNITDIPMVLGIFRPVLILPVSLLTGIPPVQLDAVIAHELAHVRRYDFLLNLIQVMIETLFFYHPAVWWLSRQIRVEREFCCDDLATRYSGDSLPLAEGLAAIEEIRIQNKSVSLAMTAIGDGQPDSTIHRINRILNNNKSTKRVNGSWLVTSSVIVLIILFSSAGHLKALPNVEEDKTTIVSNVDDRNRDKKETDKNETDQKDSKLEDKNGEAKTNTEPESWEITKIYGPDRLKEWLGSQEYLPNPVDVPAVHAHVFDSFGTPAVNAIVYSYTPRGSARIYNGGIQKPYHKQPYTKSDLQGLFGLPRRKEPYHVLVTHATGFAAVSHEDLIHKNGNIILKPWGHIDGRFHLNNFPQANQKISLKFDTTEWSEKSYKKKNQIHAQYVTTTDASGYYSFKNVPTLSGTVIAHRETRVIDYDPPPMINGPNSRSFKSNSTYSEPFTCKANETIRVHLGKGRTIKGQFKILEDKFKVDWSQIVVSIVQIKSRPPYPKELLRSNNLQVVREYIPVDNKKGETNKGVVISLSMHHRKKLKPDGTFVIHGLKPGRYQVSASIPNIFWNAQKEFIVDKLDGPAIELNDLELSHNQQLMDARLHPSKQLPGVAPRYFHQ